MQISSSKITAVQISVSGENAFLGTGMGTLH